MFTIHIKHCTHHFHLTFRVNQGQQLMNITVGIPKRKYGITITFGCQDFITFHCRIFSVYILQNIRMNQQMIKRCIKHSLLGICTTFHCYAWQVIIPFGTCFRMDLLKILSSLFTIQIQTGIFYAYKRNSHLHFYLFTFFCIEGEISTNVISCYFFSVTSIKFILSLILIPFSLNTHHRTLFLPIPCCRRILLNPQYKVNGEYSLRIITKCAK